ncbi:MAG: hypothetical protein IPK60_20900 [Sandaracinaceae bacterium]|nr:hypothetical protein [Sandaracinaceae bacterium]
MNRRIPPDAFSFYFSLGPKRSFEAVAKKYEASKRGVAEVAKREQWKERIASLEARARAAADEKALETLEAMNERHLKEARFLQSKGIERLKDTLDSVAVKAVTAGIQLERLIRGQATERTENLEHVIRRECDRWLVRDGDGADETIALAPAAEEDDAD